MITRATPRPGMGDESEHFTEAAGFLTGRSAALADWHFRRDQRDFAALCARLYARKWYLANARRIAADYRARSQAAAARAGRV